MADPAADGRASFGHYEVEGTLGRGAMGMVFLARDRRIGRRVALKTVRIEERFEDDSERDEFYQRLQREAELCGALQHPNIVTLYEPGYENGTIAWLATEYVDGESLRDRMKKRKPLPLRDAVRISEDILRGLAYAHSKGIVHRDVKPANILLTSAGEAKIADFGIARPVDSNLTAAGSMLGTPSYMSPEQVKCSAVTTRSDLFSAGAVMYEMLTGVKPFAAPDVSAILRNVVEREPAPAHEVNAAIPAELSRIVARLFAKAPEARYVSAAAALDELSAVRRLIEANAPPDEPATDEAAGLSTLPTPGAGHSTHPSLTDTGFDDATPHVQSKAAGKFLRPKGLPTAAFIATMAVFSAAVWTGLRSWELSIENSARGTVEHTPEQVREFAEKRRSLDRARALADAGKLDESLAAYDAYLARYPASIAASQRRATVLKAIEDAKAGAAKETVIAKRPRKPAPPESKKKDPLWRRIFRND